MIVAVFRRRLKPGKTPEDFARAWEAERGFGVPARVFTAISLADPREIDPSSTESLLAALPGRRPPA